MHVVPVGHLDYFEIILIILTFGEQGYKSVQYTVKTAFLANTDSLSLLPFGHQISVFDF